VTAPSDRLEKKSSLRNRLQRGAVAGTGGNWPSLPAKRNGGYCFQATAGDFAWAYFATF